MEATYIGLTEFISGEKICVIPVYQRNYDWKKSHCEQLFADLESLLNGKKPEHFLGTVVYQVQRVNSFTEQIIIDGQQRITSVILLAKAVHDLSDSAETRKRIYTAFVKNSEYDTEFKLKPSEFDSEVFRKLMNGENFGDMEISRLYLNYKFFRDKIANSNYELDKIRQAISKFQIVALKLGNENPQEIFESLNSTGKDLTQTELIRNFLLMNLASDDQERLYKDYWLAMERVLRTSENFDTFMIHYIISKRKSSTDTQDGKKIQISKNFLYPTFKSYFDKNFDGETKTAKVENFLKDLYHSSKFYRRLIFDENTDFETLPALDKKFYELIFQLGASSSPIILMDLNDMCEKDIFGEETFMQMIDALNSFIVRARVCGLTGLDNEKAGNILSRLEKEQNADTDSFWKAITTGRGGYSFPNDEQFRQALLSADFYKTLRLDKCKYILYKLEKNFGNAQILPPYENIFLDFITPSKLNRNWKNYLESKNDLDNHAAYLNSLGNLVLTDEDKKNSAVFSEKRAAFGNSVFHFTNLLFNFSDWTSRQIRRRADILANHALKIWILPEKYNQSATAEGNIFNLDSDSRNFTGTELEIVSIFGKEYKIRYWIDLLRRVAKEFYDLDKNIFVHSIQNDRLKKIFSNSPENIARPFEIDANYYIGGGIDTKTCFKFAKTIVENFDSIGGTNFKGEIWFTLKT